MNGKKSNKNSQCLCRTGDKEGHLAMTGLWWEKMGRSKASWKFVVGYEAVERE